ncbi:MAG: hypothetical protein MUC55_02535 [Burkholderiales bacterium]|jgi:hypothetical protein|nr:hypothetical protein [Burkholderiales bacterium]
MDAKKAIRIHLDVLRQGIGRARDALELPVLDAKLSGRVAARFDRELTRLAAAHSALQGMVTRGEPLDACWRELRKLDKDAGRVFEESLVFIQGALVRHARLDDGVCGLTDALLDDLSEWADISWGRFTVLATSEFYTDVAEIIRIRYPEASVWAMPLAAHEFGHFLGPELRQHRDDGYVYPFQELLKAADAARTTGLHTEEWHHAQEHFADVLATYALGPAFAAAFITLRMNAGSAHENPLTHPSGARRVHGILWTLGRMEQRDATPLQRPFADVIVLLRGLWEESLRGAGRPDKLAGPEASLVKERAAAFFDLIADATPARLAYTGADWLRATGLVADGLSPTALPGLITRRDVLNAAWLARLQADDQNVYLLNDLAKRTRALYSRIPAGEQKTAVAPGS